ncbi:MAG: hypothetical protein ABIJ56_24230 [Pseudomonadota bacterium]
MMMSKARHRVHLFAMLLITGLVSAGCRKPGGETVEAGDEETKQQPKAGGAMEEKKEKPDPREDMKSRVYAVTLDAGDAGIVYVGSAAGLVVYDAAEPSAPAELGAVYLPGSVVSIVQDGDRLYAATGPSGVAVIDVKDRRRPSLLFMADTPGGAWKAVPLKENVLAVADGSLGVTVVDISGGSDVTVIGRAMTGDYVRDIAVEREGKAAYIYAAGGKDGIVLHDATSPAAPAFLSRLSAVAEDGGVRSLHLRGSTVFGAAGRKGLIVAQRKGEKLVLAGAHDPSASDLVRGVCVDEKTNRAFLSAGEHDLVFLDVSDIAAVKPAGRFDHERSINRTVVSDERAFVAADAGGLMILDVSNLHDVKILYPKPG